MKIAIAGAGAMGSRFGIMLKNSGQSVTLLDKWIENVKKISQNGLIVHVHDKTYKSKFPIFYPKEISVNFDLIIIFTKAMAIDSMLRDIKNLIGKNTILAFFGNGLGNEETIEKYVNKKQIILGTTLWTSLLNGPGEITLSGLGSITMQPLFKDKKRKLETILHIFQEANLKPSISPNVISAIWKKASINSIVNTYCSIFKCKIGEFIKLPNSIKLINLVLEEFDKIAKREKVSFNINEIKKSLLEDIPKMSDHYPSMYQDLSRGRATEIDYLNGYIAKKGKKFSIKVPINSFLTEIIHGMEKINTFR